METTLLLIAVLVLVNALLAGSEMAFVTLRGGQIRRMRDEGPAGARLAALADDPSRLLSTVQVGITLGGFLASAAAAVNLAEPLVPRLSMFGDAAEPVAILAVTAVLTYVTLVFGELVPKRIAQQRPERWGLLVARPLTVLAAISGPVVWLLARSTDAIVRLLRFDPSAARQELTEEEVRDYIAHDSTATPAHRQILEGAFELDERTARQILVPRRDVVAVTQDATARQTLQVLAASGHSRCPVLEEADDTRSTRVVHLLDLVMVDPTTVIARVARVAPVVPESTRLLDLLRTLQHERHQLAIIADEYGAFAGIVTMEDVLEEIVGEIYDEFDRDVAGGPSRGARRSPDGTYLLTGSFPVHDLADLGIDVPPSSGAATVAGLVLEALEHLPAEGEHVQIGRWTFTVTVVERNAITEVQIRR